jgi:hypothetical protein
LYHNALSAGVVMDDILKYARTAKERAPEETSMAELKAQLQRQEKLIEELRSKAGTSEETKPAQLTAFAKNTANESTPLASKQGLVRSSFCSCP